MGQLRVEIVPVTVLGQNCTLFWDDATRRGLVIDPGGDAPRIASRVAALGLAVERILLTHGHVDHAGGAAELQEILAAAGHGAVPVEGPDARDGFLLAMLEEDAARFGLAGVRRVIPARFLAEGDAVALGSHRFDVLHVPGHTPGHLVFVERTARLAQVGDTLFRGSVGRTDFPYGETETLLGGIASKLLPLGDDLTFVCGHGPPSTIGEERRNNPFLRGR